LVDPAGRGSSLRKLPFGIRGTVPGGGMMSRHIGFSYVGELWARFSVLRKYLFSGVVVG